MLESGSFHEFVLPPQVSQRLAECRNVTLDRDDEFQVSNHLIILHGHVDWKPGYASSSTVVLSRSASDMEASRLQMLPTQALAG